MASGIRDREEKRRDLQLLTRPFHLGLHAGLLIGTPASKRISGDGEPDSHFVPKVPRQQSRWLHGDNSDGCFFSAMT